jgi:ATP-dependent DNA helicase RecQ
MYETNASACTVGDPPPETTIRDAAPVDGTPDLSIVLKRYFGFDSFRPLQGQIVADCLAGRDVVALMPTGGGKSLCYQLPALVRPGLTVVVSPLIALMKDQADFLRSRNVPTAVVNSAQPPNVTQRVLEGLDRGAYRLLYVAPERLMMPAFLARIARWNVAMIAIDEAHCISDWGHDFRPEYRQLSDLRLRFPDVPLMALTATATDRVRADIITNLGLREPGVYVASFNRPNLTYRIEPKTAPYNRLLEFLQKRPRQSGIVYCFTRRQTESLAARLSGDGFKAVPYHAGLEQPVRAKHQDLFLRDEVNVVCATIAFGMGVNKPNIRFVVHYDLPKNIESFYQETGRAGRDGDPADCLLFFSKADVINHERRIDEKATAKEQAVGRAQLDALVAFAESNACRRSQLLAYFGETFAGDKCTGCDNCLGDAMSLVRPAPGRSKDTAATLPTGPIEDRTEDARKFIACLDDIISNSRFGVGITHVTEILFGSTSEKVRRLGHDKLATYASGKTLSKPEWTHIAKQLVAQGILAQATDGMPLLSVTDRGRALLAGEGAVSLPSRTQAPVAGDCDAALFERLRQLRTELAQKAGQPAYVIFTDAALRQMSRAYPTTPDAFRRVPGVGDRKLAELGPAFMAAISEHLRSNERQQFGERHEQPPLAAKPLGDSEHDTLRRFRAGQPVERIARERGIKETTVLGHLSAAAEAGEEVPIEAFVAREAEPEIAAAFRDLGWANLTGVHERLGGRFEYNVLRMFRARQRLTAPGGQV